MKKARLFLLMLICIFSLCFAAFAGTMTGGCGSKEKMTMPDEFHQGSKEEPRISGVVPGWRRVEKSPTH